MAALCLSPGKPVGLPDLIEIAGRKHGGAGLFLLPISALAGLEVHYSFGFVVLFALIIFPKLGRFLLDSRRIIRKKSMIVPVAYRRSGLPSLPIRLSHMGIDVYENPDL